ncbi:hypothetical protein QMK33_11015 [Hymenobacter sp. H14-R3]|uniref:hypothetical protein n=1 Tax=Hymenobacter sp. H14-R3 TaxID=3046308 RepID=UPI0024BB8E4C|nr:hypothetical protein [Hymenobacter sp. H14-R3]MDJ0365683.1 hypothetical protein [Hymenobacter sp. H14-R3]
MQDYLEPVNGYFTGYSHAYHTRLRQTLLADFSDTPLAGLVVLPSFGMEYALWVGQDWQRHYAVCRVAKASIWQAMRRPLDAPVTFATHNAELPAALAEALAAVCWAALGQTRYAEKPGISLDGTYCYFTAFQKGSGFRTGKTWSPPAASRLADLRALAETLIQRITNPTNNSPTWAAELTKAAIALQARFDAA